MTEENKNLFDQENDEENLEVSNENEDNGGNSMEIDEFEKDL
jgi:tetrahydromethanopterin S-methyltransferase subunit H